MLTRVIPVDCDHSADGAVSPRCARQSLCQLFIGQLSHQRKSFAANLLPERDNFAETLVTMLKHPVLVHCVHASHHCMAAQVSNVQARSWLSLISISVRFICLQSLWTKSLVDLLVLADRHCRQAAGFQNLIG